MIGINCVYCDNKFSNEKSLHNHQKSAKYCIKLRNDNITKSDEKINNEEINETSEEVASKCNKFNCAFCNAIFTRKDTLNNHFSVCTTKKLKDQELEFIKKIKEQDEELRKKLKDQELEFIEQIKYQNEALQAREAELKKKDEALKEKDNAFKTLENKLIETTKNHDLEIEDYEKEFIKALNNVKHEKELRGAIEKENNTLKEWNSDLKKSHGGNINTNIKNTNNVTNNNTINITTYIKYLSPEPLDNVELMTYKMNFIINENVFSKSPRQFNDMVINSCLKDKNNCYKYLCLDKQRNKNVFLHNGDVSEDTLDTFMEVFTKATSKRAYEMLKWYQDKLNDDPDDESREGKLNASQKLLMFDNNFVNALTRKLHIRYKDVLDSMRLIDNQTEEDIRNNKKILDDTSRENKKILYDIKNNDLNFVVKDETKIKIK